MNLQEIKEKLPVVKIKFQNKIYNGIISGRKNDFPSVSFVLDDPATGPIISFNFSWAAIYNAINKNKPLTV
jgi:hypothetical protein